MPTTLVVLGRGDSKGETHFGKAMAMALQAEGHLWVIEAADGIKKRHGLLDPMARVGGTEA